MGHIGLGTRTQTTPDPRMQGGMGYVTPRRFKERIGRFASQFSGYQQHDSQVRAGYFFPILAYCFIGKI